MKILVTISNYGTKNDQYLRRLLEEYASMSHDVHVVALTNVQKDFGADVEIKVSVPRGDPWSFPFPHKKILAERIEDYDLFIYSEDDTLITERNIGAFIDATEVLREDEIAGFLRSEVGDDGSTYLSTVHNHFHWDPASIVSRGAHSFAFFSNEHSASYILTRRQLRRAIESGGFLVEPHQERYDLLVSAATDPYTQCGFKKLVCFSRIEDFILPHLPSKYVGQMGLRNTEFFTQVRALEAIRGNTRPCSILLNGGTKLYQSRWSKGYYEPIQQDIVQRIPAGVHRILSYGCGWGETEAEIIRRGHQVTGIPLDSVIGACAEARGVEVIYGDQESSLAAIPNDSFECIVATDMLHLVARPDVMLKSFCRLLAPRGSLIATVPNFDQLPVLWHRVARHPGYSDLGNFERTGAHLTTYGTIRKWFKEAGFTIADIVPRIPVRAEKVYQMSGKLGTRWLASEFLIVGRKEVPNDTSRREDAAA